MWELHPIVLILTQSLWHRRRLFGPSGPCHSNPFVLILLLIRTKYILSLSLSLLPFDSPLICSSQWGFLLWLITVANHRTSPSAHHIHTDCCFTCHNLPCQSAVWVRRLLESACTYLTVRSSTVIGLCTVPGKSLIACRDIVKYNRKLYHN